MLLNLVVDSKILAPHVSGSQIMESTFVVDTGYLGSTFIVHTKNWDNFQIILLTLSYLEIFGYNEQTIPIRPRTHMFPFF